MRVEQQITLVLTEKEALAITHEVYLLDERGAMGGMRQLAILRDALTDRGLGVRVGSSWARSEAPEEPGENAS